MPTYFLTVYNFLIGHLETLIVLEVSCGEEKAMIMSKVGIYYITKIQVKSAT
jgi:hypothetical protein